MDDEKNLVELSQANRLLESFSLIARTINAPRVGFERRIQEVLQIILDYLGAEQGSIMMREGRSQRLVVRAASRRELIGCHQSISGSSVAAWVAHHQEPLYVPDIDRDPRFARRPAAGQGQYRKNALLSVPILHRNKVAGIINVTDKIGDMDLCRQDISRLLDFSSVILALLVQQDLQQQLRRQRNTLRERNQELQRQQRMREELSRMLIHDLKGPLSEVVANLDILSYSLEGELGEFLESAQVACNKAVRLVSNLATIDKIEDGGFKLIREQVDPATLINESLLDIKGIAAIRGIELHSEIPVRFPEVVKIDRVMILRVLQNLLINALGYSPAETAIHFGFRVDEEQKRLEFFVQDQGPGLAAGVLTTIFEKYSRVSDQEGALVGTGLGLYFAKLAVELHGGTIGVKSRQGQGSRFYFTLPLN